MQLRIQFRNLEIAQDAKAAIERSVRLGLGRHAAIIANAHVVLASGRGRGAVEHESRIRIRLRDGDVLLGDGCDADPRKAVDDAMWRIEHRLERRRLAHSVERRVIGPQFAGY